MQYESLLKGQTIRFLRSQVHIVLLATNVRVRGPKGHHAAGLGHHLHARLERFPRHYHLDRRHLRHLQGTRQQRQSKESIDVTLGTSVNSLNLQETGRSGWIGTLFQKMKCWTCKCC